MSIEECNKLITSDGSDVQPSEIPQFTRRYCHSAAQAYNMARYLVEELKLDMVVFATAMSYWHEFATQFGERHINAVVLVAAAVFLAGKVEHYKMRVDKILRLAFEINIKPEGMKANVTCARVVEHSNVSGAVSCTESRSNKDINKIDSSATTTNTTHINDDNNNQNVHLVKPSNDAGNGAMLKFINAPPVLDECEDIEAWRTMLLQAELVLCETLHFDFQRTHPTHEIQHILDAYFNMSRCSRPNTEKISSDITYDSNQISKCGSAEMNNITSEMQQKLQSVATRLYLHSLITPLYTRLNASAVIRTIVYTTLIYAGCEAEQEDVNHYQEAYIDNYNNNNYNSGNGSNTARYFTNSSNDDTNHKKNNSVWERFPLPPEEIRRVIIHTLFDALDFMGKKTGLQLLDEQISVHRRQERIASPLGFASSVSFNNISSSPLLPFTSSNDTAA